MPFQRLAMLRIIGLDLVGPLVVYRVCRVGGLPAVWSLVISGASPGLGVLIDYARWRTLEVVGAVVLTGIAFSVVLALISGSTKAVLLEGALGLAGFATLCYLSLWRRRPLLFYFTQGFYGGRHTEEGELMEQAYAAVPSSRHYFRMLTVVWGTANLLEAVALVVIIQIVSTGTALAFNRILPWVVGVPLFAWSYRRGMRVRAAAMAQIKAAS